MSRPKDMFRRQSVVADEQLIKEVARTGNVKAAYAKLFPEVEHPSQHFRAKLEYDPDLKRMLTKLLNRQGLNLIYSNYKLKELLELNTPVFFKGSKIGEFPDGGIQLEALKTLYKLHKVLGNDNNINIDNRKVELNFNQQDFEELRNIATELNALNDKLDFNKHKILPRKEPLDVAYSTG